MSFGPNRRMLANRYIVCDQHAARLATIRLPVVNTSFGGHCFEIDDQSGAHFMTLKSAETFEQGVLDKVGALCGDDLVLVKDGEILGYTGAESQPTGSRKPVSVAGVAKGVFERASELPGLVVESIKDEFGGANRIREERVAARLTLVGAGTDLDPRFVMGVLLFKTHVFSAIRDVS